MKREIYSELGVVCPEYVDGRAGELTVHVSGESVRGEGVAVDVSRGRWVDHSA